MQDQLTALELKINEALARDRYRFSQALQRIRKTPQGDQSVSMIEALAAKLERSCSAVMTRRGRIPEVEYDSNLPVVQRLEEIKEAIASHQVVIIAGETGSGKTTQIPKICLSLGRGGQGTIGHTQPRRIAARSVARRIAQELHSEPGDIVGHKIRFSDQVKSTGLVKVMTDGILLAEIQSDRFLQQYDTLIIDEAHERSLNIDFLLGYLRRILPQRPDLKVIVTSATIDHHRFSKHFSNAPVIEVSGRMFPVEDRYRPWNESDGDDDEHDLSVEQGVLSVIEEIIDNDRSLGSAGDVLIFCSGEREIRHLSKSIRQYEFKHTEILPLYARLSNQEQERVFQAHRGRRIILATNVAETSLTIPNIRYVVDLGEARISRYSYRQKIQRLPIEAISQASANQRRGRCGRVENGVCFRLYSEQDYLGRNEFTDPELLRTNLASVILKMEVDKLGTIADFPFIEKPDNRFVNDGYRLLQELKALDEKRKLTPLGRNLARFPVDPRIAGMLLEAKNQNCLTEIIVIASALGIQDPRSRPVEHQQAADEKHRQFQDKKSDFISYVNLWNEFEEQRQNLSSGQLKKYCKQYFLSYMRMREWKETHRQLKAVCDQLKFKFNAEDASFKQVHSAILAGFLGQIAIKDEEKSYLGARNMQLNIAPGSALFHKRPAWIVAAEIVETTKVYARTVAQIEPEWVLPLCQHLIKKNYSEPRWQKKRGEVVASQNSVLYGLVLEGGRKVPYQDIDPEICRELFIQHGLVAGEINTRGKFLQHNAELIEQFTDLENKARRRDIVISEEGLYDFYNARIPEDVCSSQTFERWRKVQEASDPQVLFINEQDLLNKDPSQITEQQFPDFFEYEGLRFPLSYEFSPGKEEDGITLTTPVALLNQLPVLRLQWLVPGLFREKCIAVIKGLPKKWRRNFTPVPDYVDRIMGQLHPADVSLTHQIATALKEATRIEVPEQAWDELKVEAFYSFIIAVVDSDGKLLEKNRDLIALKEKFSGQGQCDAITKQSLHFERDHITQWDFGDLDEFYETQQAGIGVRVYPALVVSGDDVSLTSLDSKTEALTQGLLGQCRLIEMQLAQQVREIRKKLNARPNLAISYRSIGNKEALSQELVNAAVIHSFELERGLIYQQAEFERRLASGRTRLVPHGTALVSLLDIIFKHYVEVKRIIQGKINLAWAATYNDIKAQLDQLIHVGWLNEVPFEWLKQYPRYLQGIQARLEKLPAQVDKDRMFRIELEKYGERYHARVDLNQKAGIVDPELALFRWMLEEYKVSLFAQGLKTKMPISAKRLDKQWAKVIK